MACTSLRAAETLPCSDTEGDLTAVGIQYAVGHTRHQPQAHTSTQCHGALSLLGEDPLIDREQNLPSLLLSNM